MTDRQRAEQRQKQATLRRSSFHQHWFSPCRDGVPMQKLTRAGFADSLTSLNRRQWGVSAEGKNKSRQMVGLETIVFNSFLTCCLKLQSFYINNSNIPAMPKVDRLMATNFNECITALQATGQPVVAPLEGKYFNHKLSGLLHFPAVIPWCNATWDSVLCWPAIPANTSFTLPCPPLKGLDTT
ncbi:conserved hypothetical protein, partial [Trichinella spiralis]|uniref:hypothetical protein n=1 Tax=Trichinella spiralis TaxID=6334 RepID=UPI0001EFD5FB